MAGAIGNLNVSLSLSSQGLSAGFSKAASSVSSFSGNVVKSLVSMSVKGGAAIGATIGMLNDLGKTLIDQSQPGIQFEKEMSRVAAILDATGPVYDALEKKALQLGAATEFTAAQSAQAMSELATGGLSAVQVLEAITPALNLARVSGMDLKDAADLMAVSMGAFNLKASETGRVADVLSLAAIKTSSSVQDLAEAFKFAAPAAAATGRDIEEVAAVLAIMAKSGIRGSMAGTALRGIMMKMSRPTAEAASALKEIGLEFFDAQGKAKGFSTIVGEVMANLGNMNSQQQLEFLGTQFEARAATGFIAMANKGPEAIKEFEDMLRKSSAGTAERIGARQIENVWGGLKILESAVENVSVRIFNLFKEPFRNVTLNLADSISGMGDSLTNIGNTFRKPVEDLFSTLNATVSKYVDPLREKLSGMFDFDVEAGLAAFGAASGYIVGIVDRALFVVNAMGEGIAWLGGKMREGFEAILPYLRSFAEGFKTAGDAVAKMGQTGASASTALKAIGSGLSDLFNGKLNFESFRDGMIDTFIAIEFASIRWRETLEVGWLKVKLLFVNGYEDIKHLFVNKMGELAVLGGIAFVVGLATSLDLQGQVLAAGIEGVLAAYAAMFNAIGSMAEQMAVNLATMMEKLWNDMKSGKFDAAAIKFGAIIADPGQAVAKAFDEVKSGIEKKIGDFKNKGIGKTLFGDREKSDMEKELEKQIAGIDLGGAFNDFRDKRRREIIDAMRGGDGGSPVVPDAGGNGGTFSGGGSGGPAEAKFSAAVFQGSKEAIEAEMKFRADMQERAKEDVQKAQLQKQKDMAKTLEDIRELLKGTSVEFEFA